MTNGELIQKVFTCEVCEPIPEDDIIHVIFSDKKDSAIGFDWSWWNMEYKEPNSDIRLIRVKDELNRVKNELESTTKNDLAVDCIDRQATLDAIIKRLGIRNETYLLEAERVIYQQILAMPSVAPQEPRKGYLSIDDVMSVFDDFMCGEVDEDGTETFLEMLKDRAESEVNNG